MERLTIDTKILFCDISRCRETPGGSDCEDGYCDARRVYERLREYERLGSVEELREWKEAAVRNAGRWYAGALIGSADKHKVPIREGDILKLGKRRFTVRYHPNTACFCAEAEDGDNQTPCLNWGTTKGLEIVGSVEELREWKEAALSEGCENEQAE